MSFAHLTPVIIALFLLAAPRSTEAVESQRNESLSCQEQVKPLLSQMVYAWVPNSNKGALPPIYSEMIRKIRPGGLLVGQTRRAGQSVKELADHVQTLKDLYAENSGTASSRHAPFIGVDYIELRKDDKKKDDPDFEIVEFSNLPSNYGFGTRVSGDDMRDEGELGKICQKAIARIKSLAHSIVGVNHALGPSVEQIIDQTMPLKGQRQSNPSASASIMDALVDLGVMPTLKHYPFTVKGLDPHKFFASLPLQEEEIRDLDRTFFPKVNDDYVVMTTHVASPGIDRGEMVTFSKDWVGRIRDQIGQRRLIMTDGLFMIGAYHSILAKTSGLPEATIRTYFREQGKLEPLIPWSYAYAYNPQASKCLQVAEELLQANRGRDLVGKYDAARAAVAAKLAPGVDTTKHNEFDNYVAQVKSKTGCKTSVLEELLLMQNGSFSLEEARRVAEQVFYSFAKNSVLAGNDLVLFEGAPPMIQKTYDGLVQEACSPTGGELRARIEKAGQRIMDFKERNAKSLTQKADPEWIRKNSPLLDRIFFKIYPELSSGKTRCKSVNEALKALNGLSPAVFCN